MWGLQAHPGGQLRAAIVVLGLSLIAGSVTANAADAPRDPDAGFTLAAGTSADTLANAFTYTQLDWAQRNSFSQDRLIVRAKAGVGTFRERVSEASVTYLTGEAMIGLRTGMGGTQIALMAGPVIKAEQRPGGLQQIGLKARVDAVRGWEDGRFVALGASLSSIETEWAAQLSAGLPVGGTLKIGPQIGLSGTGGRVEARAGVGLYGINVAKLSLSFGLGAMLDEQRRTGLYAQSYLEHRF